MKTLAAAVALTLIGSPTPASSNDDLGTIVLSPLREMRLLPVATSATPNYGKLVMATIDFAVIANETVLNNELGNLVDRAKASLSIGESRDYVVVWRNNRVELVPDPDQSKANGFWDRHTVVRPIRLTRYATPEEAERMRDAHRAAARGLGLEMTRRADGNVLWTLDGEPISCRGEECHYNSKGELIERYSLVADDRGRNRRYGPYIKLWTDGNLRLAGAYRNDEEHGVWHEFRRDGTLRRITTYHFGAKHGLSKTFDSSNRLRETGHYAMGKKFGVWETYYPNGLLQKSVPFVDGKKEGLATLYYDDGNGPVMKTANFVADQKQGLEEYWAYSSFAPLVISRHEKRKYQDGELNGAWSSWDPQRQVRVTGSYRGGRKHGRWTRTDENTGRVSHKEYVDGREQR